MRSYSFWEEDAFLAPADIIIAGAGFAGLWSALHIKRAHPALKIIIFEKEVVPAGASTRNAGFACFGSLTELVDDRAFMGEEKMKEMLRLRYEGLKQIRETFTDHEIDYKDLGGYELISQYQYPDEETLLTDISEINKVLEKVINEDPVFSLADTKLSQFGFGDTVHLVENRLEGQLHSAKLIRSLIRKVREMGVEIISGVAVEKFESTGDAIILSTSIGVTVRTKKLLICTNALASELSDHISVTPARGQVLLTGPIEDLPFEGCFHYDEGYYYFRNLDGRVLLGGARNLAFAEEESSEMITTEIIQNELERFLQEVVIPGKKFTIEKRWSGIMGMGQTKFPDIREIEPNIFCAVGLGGIGIAVAPEVGRIVAGMM